MPTVKKKVMKFMEKKVQARKSTTAQRTCLSRAGSFYEKNAYLKSEDHIATRMIPSPIKTIIIVKYVAGVGEKWKFFIEKGQIERFLDKYDFELVDESDAGMLEDRFFKDKSGNKFGRVNEVHSIVKARRK